MPRFLVEVPHENTKEACDRAIRVFLETGSHFMTNADWGCGDGVHKAWFVIDVEEKEDARAMLPPLFRQSATIVELQRFRPEDVEDTRRHHED
ncbi:MAG TPA: hypothetical protein VFI11_10760 [Anaerolineales bacterium]|nr:hypothetical protein [Anaerolineales bacterium]